MTPAPAAGLDREDDTAESAGDEARGSRDERRCGPCNDERVDERGAGLSALDLGAQSADPGWSMRPVERGS